MIVTIYDFSKKFADQIFSRGKSNWRMSRRVRGQKFEIVALSAILSVTWLSLSWPRIFPDSFRHSSRDRQCHAGGAHDRRSADSSIPIQKQFAALDPSLPVSEIFTMQQIVGKSTAGQVSMRRWCWRLPRCPCCSPPLDSMECCRTWSRSGSRRLASALRWGATIAGTGPGPAGWPAACLCRIGDRDCREESPPAR